MDENEIKNLQAVRAIVMTPEGRLHTRITPAMELELEQFGKLDWLDDCRSHAHSDQDALARFWAQISASVEADVLS